MATKNHTVCMSEDNREKLRVIAESIGMPGKVSTVIAYCINFVHNSREKE